MKQLTLTAMLISTTICISNSQTSVDDIYSCVNPLFNTLTICFDNNDVTGRYTGSGSILYFQSDAGIQYTQLETCVNNYNKDRTNCPTAPLLVLGNGVKNKKTITR